MDTVARQRTVMEKRHAPGLGIMPTKDLKPILRNSRTPAVCTGEVLLRFKVQADLVVDRKQYSLDVKQDDPAFPSKVFLAAWIGGGNKGLSLYEIAPDGTTGVELRVREGDVNTLKLGVSFNLRGTSGGRNCHLASSFVPIAKIVSILQQGNTWVVLQDNFEQGNKALLHMENNGTNLAALQRMELRDSVLLQMETISNAVHDIGQSLQTKLEELQISPKNAGPQYVTAFTFCHMQGMLSHYALLGHLFRSMPSPIGLEWAMYAAYQTVQSTALQLRVLQKMADHDLVANFGTNLVSRLTSCELTAPYSPDVTIGKGGRVNKPSEDIQRSLC